MSERDDPDFRQRMHFMGPPGFKPCTRLWPHDGSCAHAPINKEPVRVVSKEELLDLLRHITLCVEADDSFEGMITWSATREGFEVSGAYRFGNSEGQGSVRLLDEP